MEPPPRDGAGLIVVRMWIDEHPSHPLRARITYVPDVSREDETMVWRQSPAGIAAEIVRILEDFVTRRST
jgi:hypothetical protein